MVTIQHASAYAENPKLGCEHLAAICGGRVVPFGPLKGGWIVFFEGGAFIELYPRGFRLKDVGGDTGFEPLPVPSTGAGSHFNLTVDRTRKEVEAICAERKIPCAPRPGMGFLDVWIDDGVLVECVCSG